MSEQQLQDAIVDYAHLKGWVAAHFAPARTAQGYRTPCRYDAQGFPDLVLARAGKVIFAEIKSATGKVSPDQQIWLLATGGYVWRPQDWLDGTIEGILA